MKGLLSNFKKLKEDKKMVTMGHEKGHTITILKSKLSALQRKQIEALPIYAANGLDTKQDAEAPDMSMPSPVNSVPGAPVPSELPFSLPSSPDPQGQFSDDSGAPSTPSPPEADQPVNANQSNGNSLPVALTDLPGQGQPVIADDQSNSPRSTPQRQSQDGVDVNAAYRKGLGAIYEQQKVSSDLSKSEQALQEKDLKDRQDLNQVVQQNYTEFANHHKQLMDDYMQGHIDPRHYQESMSSGQKTGTAIGLLLGGIGGALTHTGVNPAADFLNKQIDRDIESQKSRIDQQKTLLGANQDLYHDQVLATNATRMNLNDIYSHQMQLAATRLGTPQAKAIADAESSKFAMQNAGLLQQNAIRSGVLQALQGGGQGVDPVTLGHAGFMSPEEANKEQASLDRQKQTISTIKSIYSQMDKEQQPENALNPMSYKRVSVLNAQLAPLIQSEDPSKRLTPDVYEKLIEPFQIKTTDDNNVRLVRAQGMLNLAKQAHAGELPNTSRLAPAVIPNYDIPGGQGSSAGGGGSSGSQNVSFGQSAQRNYKVGQTFHIGDQRYQIINSNGDSRAVK